MMAAARFSGDVVVKAPLRLLGHDRYAGPAAAR